MEKRILIAGIGNRLMGDDGFGSFLVEELIKKKRIQNDCVEIIDYGISAISLFHDLADYNVAIFVDVVERQKQPGTIYHLSLTREDIDKITVEEANEFFTISFHEIDLEKLLTLSKALDVFPDYVELIGVEPDRISSGIGLSDTLKSVMNKVEDLVVDLTMQYVKKVC